MIKVLDQNTINKIAAGEVIEKPSSVIKELVENSIDSGATAITVEVKGGGLSFMRVTDNGAGINKDEVKLAFKRHATSKLVKVEDLLSISSLGFRGEALASIAAVSQVELISKTADDVTGIRYQIHGGAEISSEEIGCPNGTTIVVRNLFYNTPARKKFMKTDATETSYIYDLMCRICMSHPEVSFKFIANGTDKIFTSGNGKLKDIIYHIYGRDITSNLLEINAENDYLKISGYIARPCISRGNRSFEGYYVNHRYIKSAVLTKAIEDAFRTFVMIHKFPFTEINFDVKPDLIDVNVHPTKMELRFSNNEYIYNFVYDTCLKALKSKELIAEVSVPEPANAVKEPINVVKEPEKVVEKPANPIKANDCRLTAQRLPEPFEIKRSQQMVREDKVKYEEERKAEAPKQLNLFENKLLDESSRNKYRIIGQLFETYWLIEFEDKFYIMDQHAAHEKILYEKTMERLHNKTMGTQMILPPIVLSLNMHEEEIYRNNADIFKSLGYEIEEFGGSEYKVTGIPAGLPKMDYKQLLIDVLDGLSEENANKDPDIITEKVASMSCKAAVKGNNRLSFSEAFELMDELMKAENPYNCPHGRPTLIMMSKYEIEKKFKRIV